MDNYDKYLHIVSDEYLQGVLQELVDDAPRFENFVWFSASISNCYGFFFLF